MNQKELKQEIRDRKFRNLYIFCSDDYFLKKLYRERIRGAGEFDFEVIDINDESEIYKIAEHSNSNTLFSRAKKRIIYARIHYILSSYDIKSTKSNIIILDPAGCKNLKHKNLVKFETPTEDEIDKFIVYKIGQNGKKIEKKAADFILKRFVNKDTSSLNIFLEKVLLYNIDKEIIKYEDVEKLAENVQNYNVFKLAEYVMQNDSAKFFNEVDGVLDSIHPSVVVSIIANEAIKTVSSGLLNDSELASTPLKIRSSIRYKQYFKTLGIKRLTTLLNLLNDMDLIIKSLNVNGFLELFKARMFIWFAAPKT